MNGRELKKILQEYLFEKLEFKYFLKGRKLIILPVENIITIVGFDNRSYDNDGFYLHIHSFPLYNEKDFIHLGYGYSRIKWFYREEVEKNNGKKLNKLISKYLEKIRQYEDPIEFYKYLKKSEYIDQLVRRKDLVLTACLIGKENYLELIQELKKDARIQIEEDAGLVPTFKKIEKDCELLLELNDLDKIQDQLQKWRRQTIKNLGFDKFID